MATPAALRDGASWTALAMQQSKYNERCMTALLEHRSRILTEMYGKSFKKCGISSRAADVLGPVWTFAEHARAIATSRPCRCFRAFRKGPQTTQRRKTSRKSDGFNRFRLAWCSARPCAAASPRHLPNQR